MGLVCVPPTCLKFLYMCLYIDLLKSYGWEAMVCACLPPSYMCLPLRPVPRSFTCTQAYAFYTHLLRLSRNNPDGNFGKCTCQLINLTHGCRSESYKVHIVGGGGKHSPFHPIHRFPYIDIQGFKQLVGGGVILWPLTLNIGRGDAPVSYAYVQVKFVGLKGLGPCGHHGTFISASIILYRTKSKCKN